MKRTTDKLIALQFLAVVLPIAVVLVLQMVVDARRAAELDHSRPLRILAEEARAHYRTFTNGAADAVDTGALGAQSVEALRASAARLSELAGRDGSAVVGDAAGTVEELAATVPRGATLKALLVMRPRILRGDVLTKAIADEFAKKDENVVKDAIASAERQKRAVTGALVITAILTVVFVMATRRRLKASLEADIAAERQRRAELETFSVRFGVATRAARAGVYELKRDGSDVWWSDTMFELYGQSPQEFRPTMPAWLELIHADDREQVPSGGRRDGSTPATRPSSAENPAAIERTARTWCRSTTHPIRPSSVRRRRRARLGLRRRSERKKSPAPPAAVVPRLCLPPGSPSAFAVSPQRTLPSISP